MDNVTEPGASGKRGPQARGYTRKFPRRPPRLTQSKNFPVWFVTFCTHRREAWLASPEVHAAFIKFAERAAADFNVAVGRYVIMPDHVHFFVCGDHEFRLQQWLGGLKQALARGAAKSRADDRIWQEGFFDHLLRSNESMTQKWDYIRENPVRAGLVADSGDWPYQGEIIALDRV